MLDDDRAMSIFIRRMSVAGPCPHATFDEAALRNVIYGAERSSAFSKRNRFQPNYKAALLAKSIDRNAAGSGAERLQLICRPLLAFQRHELFGAGTVAQWAYEIFDALVAGVSWNVAPETMNLWRAGHVTVNWVELQANFIVPNDDVAALFNRLAQVPYCAKRRIGRTLVRFDEREALRQRRNTGTRTVCALSLSAATPCHLARPHLASFATSLAGQGYCNVRAVLRIEWAELAVRQLESATAWESVSVWDLMLAKLLAYGVLDTAVHVGKSPPKWDAMQSLLHPAWLLAVPAACRAAPYLYFPKADAPLIEGEDGQVDGSEVLDDDDINVRFDDEWIDERFAELDSDDDSDTEDQSGRVGSDRRCLEWIGPRR